MQASRAEQTQQEYIAMIAGIPRPTFSYVEEEDIDEELICPICHSPFVNPVQTVCCRVCFCQDCLSRTSSCPLCRYHFGQNQKFQDTGRLVNNLVNRLLVRCSDCGAECERGDFEVHVDKHCPVYCPFECGSQLSRSTLLEHEPVCDGKIVFCMAEDVGCQATMPKRDKQEHESFCPFVALRSNLLAMQNRLHLLEERVAQLIHNNQELLFMTTVNTSHTKKHLSCLTDIFFHHSHHSSSASSSDGGAASEGGDVMVISNATFSHGYNIRLDPGMVYKNCTFEPGFKFMHPPCLKGITFIQCKLHGADFSLCGSLDQVRFQGCHLEMATFHACRLTNVSFQGEELSFGDIACTPPHLEMVDWTGAVLDNSSRQSAERCGAQFSPRPPSQQQQPSEQHNTSNDNSCSFSFFGPNSI
ncbi:ligand of numb-protein X [Balamuthia mandrillaris]